jgi:8-oxo-dGTP diphosphatase
MNSELYDNQYSVPKNIVDDIRMRIMASNDTGEGIKRAKFIVKNGYCTYQMLKRLKNFFDDFNLSHDSKDQYNLAGGTKMRYFVEQTLNSERDRVKKSKENKSPLDNGMNQKELDAPDGNVKLSEGKTRNRFIKENEEKELFKSALAILFNKDAQVLLLKRSFEENWMPHKWALVGGKIEEGEEPVEACKREIMEETGIEVNKFKESFVIQRNDTNVEHVFIGMYDGKPHDVKLNEEHCGYGWFSKEEIDGLDSVPNLVDYVQIGIEKNY